MQIQYVASQTSGADSHLTAISDLEVVHTLGGQTRLYVASQSHSGVLVLDPETGLSITGQDTGGQAGATGGLDAPHGLIEIQVQDQTAIVSVGRYGRELEARWLTDNGQPATAFTLDLGNAPEALQAAAGFESHSGRTLLVTAGRSADGVMLWDLGNDPSPEAAPLTPVATTQRAGDVTDLAHLRIGDRDMVLTLSAKDAALTAFWADAEEGLVLADRLDPQEGLYISTPTKLGTSTVAGQPYVLVGAAGSGTLSVAAVLPNGTLHLTDQVGDDRATRFAGVSLPFYRDCF